MPMVSLTIHLGQNRIKILFASYSTGFKLSFQSVARIFPIFLKTEAQEQPSPLNTTGRLGGSWISASIYKNSD